MNESGVVDDSPAHGTSPTTSTTIATEQQNGRGDASIGTGRSPKSIRLRAARAFLMDHPASLLPLASRYRDQQPLFESSIRGPSMQPAIPVNSRLRIRVQGHEPNRPGDVVFFRTGDDYMVHRVAYRVRHWSGRSFLLTCGDARLAADAPLDESQVLGIVISIRTKKVWRDPGPAIIGSIFRKATRALTLMIMIVVTSLSVPAASRMAALLLRMELVGRSVVRRIRRAREIGVQPQ